MVVWTSVPYTLQADVELTEYTPAIRIKAGALVCDAEYYNKVAGAPLWYTPMQGDARKTVVRMQQVVTPDVKLTPISDTNKLPSSMNKGRKQEAANLGAGKMDSDQHDAILDEICRREALEHDEVDDDDSDEEESDANSSDEDDAAADDA